MCGLGLAVDVVSESGQSVVNEKGELVCRQPFPAMPVEFFGDTDGSKYGRPTLNDLRVYGRMATSQNTQSETGSLFTAARTPR